MAKLVPALREAVEEDDQGPLTRPRVVQSDAVHVRVFVRDSVERHGPSPCSVSAEWRDPCRRLGRRLVDFGRRPQKVTSADDVRLPLAGRRWGWDHVGMIEDFEHCYRALESRDPRFDGWFVVAVTSTGVYCRPSCPAATPKRANVRFYPTAAAAGAAGFRPCLRCRPSAAPGSPEWDTRADLAGRAMRLIADGVVDREGVAGLARRVAYSPRHLHRQLVAELGAGPRA